MHEVSLAEGILDAVMQSTPKNTKVIRVKIEVGQLAGVDIEALDFAWISVRRGSVADEAILDIDRPIGQSWCMKCAQNVPISRLGDPCPKCGGYQLIPVSGDQLRVIDLEVKDI